MKSSSPRIHPPSFNPFVTKKWFYIYTYEWVKCDLDLFSEVSTTLRRLGQFSNTTFALSVDANQAGVIRACFYYTYIFAKYLHLCLNMYEGHGAPIKKNGYRWAPVASTVLRFSDPGSAQAQDRHLSNIWPSGAKPLPKFFLKEEQTHLIFRHLYINDYDAPTLSLFVNLF